MLFFAVLSSAPLWHSSDASAAECLFPGGLHLMHMVRYAHYGRKIVDNAQRIKEACEKETEEKKEKKKSVKQRTRRVGSGESSTLVSIWWVPMQTLVIQALLVFLFSFLFLQPFLAIWHPTLPRLLRAASLNARRLFLFFLLPLPLASCSVELQGVKHCMFSQAICSCRRGKTGILDQDKVSRRDDPSG